MEQELKAKDVQKNKYADHISKLENRCRNQVSDCLFTEEQVRRPHQQAGEQMQEPG